MAYLNHSTANNVQAQLYAGVSASATSAILSAGQGTLFPAPPFRVKVEKYDTAANGYRVLKREIMLVTAVSVDTFTWIRSYENCPASYSATAQTNTAFSFDSGDTVSLVLTAGQIKDVQDEVARLETAKVNAAGGTRTGLTASRILKTEGSGAEGYVSPGTGGQFLADDLTFKTISTIDAMFGDGSDGDLVVSSGTTNLVMGTAYNYSSIAIAAGATLSTASSDGTLILKCKGVSSGTGTINLSWKGNNGNLVSTILSKTLTAGSIGSAGNGGAGGTNGGTAASGGTAAGGYGGGGGGGGAGTGVTGGVGGGGGTPGGTGGTSANGGVGGSAYSNNGGTANYTGTTTTNGGNGGLSSGGGGHSHSSSGWSSGGGGAGGIKWSSGGNLVFYSFDFSGALVINCAGAAGGNGGNGGGGGTSGGKAGGGGGWGAGGGGGCANVVSGNSAFAGSVSVTFGNGGTGGTAGSTGYGGGGASNGGAGSNWTAGQSYTARLKEIF